MSASKPKIAFCWCASCGGCEESILDLGADLLQLADKVDIVFWPVALDYKKSDVESLPDGSIQVSLVNGAICTSDQEEMADLMRRKSEKVVAFGSCAQLGGVPGLANLWSRDEILATVFPGCDTYPMAEGFQNRVRTLDQVIDVDYYVPGCPPTAKVVAAAIETLLNGTPPDRGAVLAPDRALCEECPRLETKPEEPRLKQFHRPHEVQIDEGTCLLAQGLLCLGPATRAGCEARCIGANMPCTGCFGPTSRIRDFGGKALSAIASTLSCDDPAEIRRAFQGIPDPAGTFYRYSLPASRLRETRAHSGR